MKMGYLPRSSRELMTRLESSYKEISTDSNNIRKLAKAVIALGLTSTLSATSVILHEKRVANESQLSTAACNLAVINCVDSNNGVLNNLEEVKAGEQRKPKQELEKQVQLEVKQQPTIPNVAPNTISIPIPGTIKKAGIESIHPSIPHAYPGRVGVDISWPSHNCTAEIPADAAFGIVGVNGGRNFTVNPCLKSEVEKFNKPSLYVNSGFPGYDRVQEYKDFRKNCEANDVNCYAYNYGFAAGKFAVEQANVQEIKSPVWWVDVETANSWSRNQNENTNSIQGEIDAIVAYNKELNGIDVAIGIYSTRNMWHRITGNWQNGLPNWVASGTNNPTDALKKCNGNNFTGGHTVMSQYVQDNLDRDIVC